jgi:hypothetical protein
MNIQFGSGILYGLPVGGDLTANPTPVEFGLLQDANLTVKSDLKKLYGQQQFASAVARGKIEVSVKAKLAVFDPMLINQLYFGQSAAAGRPACSYREPQTAAADVAVANAAAYQDDLGVLDALTAQPFTRVTGAPASGQYQTAVIGGSAGHYEFAAADAGRAVLISYTYTVASGQTITLVNQLMGHAPVFRAFLFSTFRNELLGVDLSNCVMGQLGLPTKQDDFWVYDIDFEAAADAAGALGKIYADQ